MNNKGALSTVIVAIVMVAFLLLALFWYFIGPEALYVGLTQGIDKAVEKVFSAFKKEQFKGPTAEIDKNVENAYNNIISVLRSEGKGPCVLSRGGLANDFKGYRILLSKTEDGGIFVQLIDKKDVTVRRDTIFGKLPCVVGEGNAAKNFYNNYLTNKVCEPNCKNDYTIITNIEFKDGNSVYVNGEKRSLKDENFLFKTKDGNICFFPTYKTGVSVLKPWEIVTKYGCDVGEEGIDDDCISRIKEKILDCQKLDEWPKILQDYEKNKCRLNKYTCRVESLGCQCFSSGLQQNKQKPEICGEKEPYCYDGVYGCDDKGPDFGDRLEVCKQILKDNFELARKCEVDKSNCQIKNAPCSCYTSGAKATGKMPHVCVAGQYCYNEQIGCSNEVPTSDKPLYIEYCKKSNKN